METCDNSAGDAAAMRELVRRIAKSLGGKAEVAPATMTPHEVAILDQCRAALAKPPRNCDRTFIDRPAMYYEFKDWCNAKGHTMEPKLAYDAFDWLLATANEKGATDGR